MGVSLFLNSLSLHRWGLSSPIFLFLFILFLYIYQSNIDSSILDFKSIAVGVWISTHYVGSARDSSLAQGFRLLNGDVTSHPELRL